MFEEEPNQLLERLPIRQVLAVSDGERKGEEAGRIRLKIFLNDSLKAEIAQILKSGRRRAGHTACYPMLYGCAAL